MPFACRPTPHSSTPQPQPGTPPCGITLQPAADSTHDSTIIPLPVRRKVVVPQPAYSQQHNIHSGNAHAEEHSRSAFAGSSCFVEVGIHDAHGDQVEEEVTPVQGTILRSRVGVGLEAAPCNCVPDMT